MRFRDPYYIRVVFIVVSSVSSPFLPPFFHFLLLANVEVVERGSDELQGLVQGVRIQATGVQNVHSEAYVPARESIIGRGHCTFGLISKKLCSAKYGVCRYVD